jgi:hypothetical protein
MAARMGERIPGEARRDAPVSCLRRNGDTILPQPCYRDRKSGVMMPGCWSAVNGEPCTCYRVRKERRDLIKEVLHIMRDEGLPFDGGMGVVPQHAVARAVKRITELATEPRKRKPRREARKSAPQEKEPR